MAFLSQILWVTFMPKLEVKDLNINFGGIKALSGVSFSSWGESIVWFDRSQRRGKDDHFEYHQWSVSNPLQGIYFWMRKNIVGLKPHQIAEMGVARTFQNIELFKNMIGHR